MSPSFDKLQLYNTLTRRVEPFVPLDPACPTMYVCGPTVYNYVHIGNARGPVVFDVLIKLLRRNFPKVTYARNITDVDDKINAEWEDQRQICAGSFGRAQVLDQIRDRLPRRPRTF